MLGSHSALCAVHRGVRGVDKVQLTAVLAGHVDQGLLGRAVRRVGGLPGHGRLREELGPEVFDRKTVVVTHDTLGPLAAGVLTLPGDLLVELGRIAKSQLEGALALQMEEPSKTLPEILIDKGFVDDRILAEALRTRRVVGCC